MQPDSHTVLCPLGRLSKLSIEYAHPLASLCLNSHCSFFFAIKLLSHLLIVICELPFDDLTTKSHSFVDKGIFDLLSSDIQKMCRRFRVFLIFLGKKFYWALFIHFSTEREKKPFRSFCSFPYSALSDIRVILRLPTCTTLSLNYSLVPGKLDLRKISAHKNEYRNQFFISLLH